MECFRNLFSREGLIYNIGSYVLSLIILIFIISSIIFFTKGKKSIYNKIYNIIKIKKDNEQKNNNNRKNRNVSQIIKSKTKEKNKAFRNNSKSKNKIRAKKRNLHSKKQLNNLINSSFEIIKKEKQSEFLANNFIDYEINNFSYKEAIETDKRTYLEYYISLLKSKHLLIFAFYPTNDYNSTIIKISLFFFSFALFFAINTLFLLIQQCIIFMKIKEYLIFFFFYQKYYIQILFVL